MRDVIDDGELRRLAARHSRRRVLVMVEPRHPTTARTVERGHGAAPSRPVEVAVPASTGTGDPILAGEIARITGRPPQYLPAAAVFVTEVTGGQLARIASLRSVAAIHPCRHVGTRPAPTVGPG